MTATADLERIAQRIVPPAGRTGWRVTVYTKRYARKAR